MVSTDKKNDTKGPLDAFLWRPAAEESSSVTTAKKAPPPAVNVVTDRIDAIPSPALGTESNLPMLNLPSRRLLLHLPRTG